ncbi:uncharacterized protein EI90DRAFT_183514 [Cantharellus anzutake]|uniref:uncharacterized protein n=1 Tax=Cantharellus anzutake TaxID=1750568 RepID=UPI00190715BC|nr:uncharacterized protein EI90DRAFT_183514 [Cantharellus anzutake]KAF8336508.1 hypothetical protein EI90DRAFT_183514 [Cantharellus anzutake]
MSLPGENRRVVRGAVSTPRYSTFVHVETWGVHTPTVPTPIHLSFLDLRESGGPKDNFIHSNPQLRPVFSQPLIAPTAAESQSSQRVTVMVDRYGELAPKLAMRLSRDSLPTADRALTIAVNKQVAGSSLVRERSIKANQSLFRYRPEYFASVPYAAHTPLKGANGRGSRLPMMDEPAEELGPAFKLHSPHKSSDDLDDLETFHSIMSQFPSAPASFPKSHSDCHSPCSSHGHVQHEENQFADTSPQAHPDSTEFIANSGLMNRSPGPANENPAFSFNMPEPSVSSSHPGTASTSKVQTGPSLNEVSDASPSSFVELVAPRRTEIRRRRVLTVGLAPLDVFRNRFAGQRRARKERLVHSISLLTAHNAGGPVVPGGSGVKSSGRRSEPSITLAPH